MLRRLSAPLAVWLVGALLVLALVPLSMDARNHAHKDGKGNGHGHGNPHKTPTPIVTPTPSPAPGTLTVVIHDYTDTWSPYVQQSVTDWDAAVAYRGIDILYVRERAIPCDTFVNPPSTASACEAAVLGSGTLAGLTYGSYLDGHIELYSIPDPVNGMPTYLTCHELGHLFGLSHQPEGVESCMSPGGINCPGCDQTKPSALDASLAFPGVQAASKRKHT